MWGIALEKNNPLINKKIRANAQNVVMDSVELKEFAIENELPERWVDEMLTLSPNELVEQLIMAITTVYEVTSRLEAAEADIEDTKLSSNIYMVQYNIDDSIN